ncbi:MAG: peptide deformylase [Bacillota bacterium]
MAVREILLLGNPQLYEVSTEVETWELDPIGAVIEDLHDTLMDFRKRYGRGRAIAAPQIGVMKRLVCMRIDEPLAFINPVLTMKSVEMMEVWDDCMSFPDLLVRVLRHRRCRLLYRDMNWNERYMDLEGDLAELLQHECDHLDGVLAVSRAIDGRSFALRAQLYGLDNATTG